MRFLYEPVWMLKFTELPEERVNYIRTAFDIMERFLEKSPYLCGDDLTIADLCCVATISSTTRILPLDPIKHAKLIDWMQRMAQLPYYERANVEGAEGIQDLLLKMLQDNVTQKS